MKKQNRFKTFIGGLYSSLISVLKLKFSKEKILKYLEEKAIKAVLKKLLIVGGLKGWIISFVIGEVVELGDEYLLEPALRKANWLSDRADGTKQFGRIQDAENRDEWRDSVRNS